MTDVPEEQVTALGEEQDDKFDAKAFLARAPLTPGVYIFYDKTGNTLYVGKAKQLRKRLSSYFRQTGLTPKTQVLVQHIHHAEVQQTRSESEALLLENNLIKHRKPRYNIALRDDKSFPYIHLTSATFARFHFYRGQRRGEGKYFGPFANAKAVREMLTQIHKIFKVRQCRDNYFANRSRPCLQHQIQRCSAPCVGLISEQDHADDIRQASAMLAGDDARLMEELAQRMEEASIELKFEEAARYRDRIALLQRVRERQFVDNDLQNADVVAVVAQSGWACFNVVPIRGGRNLGSHQHYQRNPLDLDESGLLSAFLPQYYLLTDIPAEIILSHEISDGDTLQSAFGEHQKRKVVIKSRTRSYRAKWLEAALLNAQSGLQQHLNENQAIAQQMIALQTALQLPELPKRMECFDVSHTMGEKTVASCVVFDEQGPVKNDYRRFNISGIEPGDDYAAMAQVLRRRYQGILDDEGKWPDLVILDGGKGQLSAAVTLFSEMQVLDKFTLVAVSKGEERRAGEELLHQPGKALIKLGGSSPALHVIQRIRDEAHRFAITGHRQRRAKARTQSILQDIPGVGEQRRKALLRAFGGIQEIKRAGVGDLQRVSGISAALAQSIHDYLHRK